MNAYCTYMVTLINFYLFPVLALGHGKTEILSEHETILESGDNFTVLCQGQTPLKWRWPMVKDQKYQNWTTISEIEVLQKKANYKYARKLFIQNITYPYTGFYQCLDKNVESFEDNDGSSIYLYVRDQEHLSVSDAEVETVTVTQYDEAVIPCRPTSPDVDVELTFNRKAVSFNFGFLHLLYIYVHNLNEKEPGVFSVKERLIVKEKMAYLPKHVNFVARQLPDLDDVDAVLLDVAREELEFQTNVKKRRCFIAEGFTAYLWKRTREYHDVDIYVKGDPNDEGKRECNRWPEYPIERYRCCRIIIRSREYPACGSTLFLWVTSGVTTGVPCVRRNTGPLLQGARPGHMNIFFNWIFLYYCANYICGDPRIDRSLLFTIFLLQRAGLLAASQYHRLNKLGF
ncbi:hypothetical protein Zmor_011480 [Zophobas morio]|uniref:Ig-like domain-containing protein n=1 Tax=Zophobas morio TaxID=2755281 RepID=A0AA38MKZ5_9CUCU|nr:hypothetical protein Zmor_011480 [Zophobas morio]